MVESHVVPARFEVWAPRAHQVRVHVEGTDFALAPDSAREGWWVLDDIAPQPGARYSFSLFNGTQWSHPMPDPRTRAQPDGVHGPSEVVSTEFSWTDSAWAGIETKDLRIYELHVGTFSRRCPPG